MQYPIKYIENNLVWNHDGECFAYYELIPYNYSFLSVEQKEAVHDAFRQLIARTGTARYTPCRSARNPASVRRRSVPRRMLPATCGKRRCAA